MLACRRGWVLFAALAAACGDDTAADDGAASETGSSGSTSAGTAQDDGGSGSGSATESTGADDGSETATPDTGDVDTSTSTTDDDSSSESTGAPIVCEEYATGVWGDCIDDKGGVDNSVCMWVPGRTAGMASCFTAPGDAGAVCNIVGCVDACDCFAPPDRGTATVVCDDFGGGQNACGLACDDSHLCPDGMDCVSGLCFHP